MTDLRAEITMYGLRLINETPAGQPIARSRRLLLTPKPNDQKVNQINLLFRDNGPAIVGDVQRLTDGNVAVRVYLPYNEFPVYYNVLQTEKPVRAQIIFDGDLLPNQVIPIRFAMLYVDKPVGEGPQDN
ncbi:hypothetical protein [Spirosoma rhododendri]|uniref:Uncharacterized protein n=1 Tax=Spirosoma rhododendri TaxID=2728024 RepID=A0A7L5DJQ9_9BACT|nr:hypothetical protein [Spirosoma rhododendri]QJD77373.1 hypothetical protein HH216_02265 [Spirosoma rhododendri]